MTTQQQKIKGRAMMYLDRHYEPQGIDYPKTGEVFYNAVEVKELFDKFKVHLEMPEGYDVIGVYFDVMMRQWLIIVESDDLPLPKPNEYPIMLYLQCIPQDDGTIKVSL